MSSISDGWQPRHKDALRAWEQGDTERLSELCSLEIRTAVRGAFGRHGKLRDIQGAQEELQAFARKGVEKAAGRYDPSKGPFQAYASQDIYWETQRGAEALQTEILQQEALQEEARQRSVPDEVEQEAESAEEQAGRGLEGAFKSVACDQWRDSIKGLGKEELSTLRSFLDEKKADLTRGDPKLERKHKAILANVIERGIVLDLENVRKRRPNAKFVEILGPLRVASIREQQKSKRLPAETTSYSNLSRLLTQHGKLFHPAYSVSDKTIKKWDKRIAENPEYEEHELLDRLHSIVDPSVREEVILKKLLDEDYEEHHHPWRYWHTTKDSGIPF